MKLPIGIIAKAALRFGIRAVAKAAADGDKPSFTIDDAKKAVASAVVTEAVRQIAKRT